MKVIELRAWYLDWTTKPANTRREINQALSEETFDDFLGEVNIKDLETTGGTTKCAIVTHYDTKINYTRRH